MAIKVQLKQMRSLCLALGLLTVAASAVRAGVDFTRSGYRSATLFTDGADNHWAGGGSFVEGQFSAGALGQTWRLRVAHVRPESDLHWASGERPVSSGGDDRLTGRLLLRKPYVQTTLQMETRGRIMVSSLSYRLLHDSRMEWSAGVEVRPHPRIGGGIRTGRVFPWPAYSELSYEYAGSDQIAAREGGVLHWRGYGQTTDVTLRFMPISGLAIETARRQVRLEPGQPADETASGSYSAAVDGFWSEQSFRAEYLLRADWCAVTRYRRLRAETRLRGFSARDVFAHFGVVEAEGLLWSVQLDHADRFLKYLSGHLSGEARGVVEAWPFAEGLMRFLGERRHVAVTGDVTWHLVSAGGRMWDSGRYRIHGVLDFLHIAPDLRYATWRPLLFGFGIDDLENGRFKITAADLIRLQLKPAVRFGNWLLAFEVSQWLPLSVREAVNETSSKTAGERGETVSGDGPRTWAGLTLSIQLRSEF